MQCSHDARRFVRENYSRDNFAKEYLDLLGRIASLDASEQAQVDEPESVATTAGSA